MKNKNSIELPEKRKCKDPLDEMMNDIIRWEYKYRAAERPLVEMLRSKYVIKRKNQK